MRHFKLTITNSEPLFWVFSQFGLALLQQLTVDAIARLLSLDGAKPTKVDLVPVSSSISPIHSLTYGDEAGCELFRIHFSVWLTVVFLPPYSLIGGSDYKLIYRHYATLYFVFCVDSSESELGILDLIQVSFDFILLLYGHLHKPDTTQAPQNACENASKWK